MAFAELRQSDSARRFQTQPLVRQGNAVLALDPMLGNAQSIDEAEAPASCATLPLKTTEQLQANEFTELAVAKLRDAC